MSKAQATAWITRRQKMRRARYACPRCGWRFTFDCLVNGPLTPIHAAPGLVGDCSGTGMVLTRARHD